jgi:hypothetical protein
VPSTVHKDVELIEPATKSYRAGYIETDGENSSEASPQTDEVYPYPNSCGFRSM